MVYSQMEHKRKPNAAAQGKPVFHIKTKDGSGKQERNRASDLMKQHWGHGTEVTSYKDKSISSVI